MATKWYAQKFESYVSRVFGVGSNPKPRALSTKEVRSFSIFSIHGLIPEFPSFLRIGCWLLLIRFTVISGMVNHDSIS